MSAGNPKPSAQRPDSQGDSSAPISDNATNSSPTAKSTTEKTKDSATNPAKDNPSAAAAAKGSDNNESAMRRFLGKMESIMPLWAWVVALGVVLAIALSITAAVVMKTMDVGTDSLDGEPRSFQPSYPAATTTGKWDDAPDIEGGDGSAYVDPNYNYVPPAPVETEPTSESSSAPSETSSKKPPKPEPGRGEKPEKPRKPSNPGNGNPAPDNPPAPTSEPSLPEPPGDEDPEPTAPGEGGVE